MKKYLILILFLLNSVYPQEKTKLIILHTTDVHGNISPYDYFEDRPARGGLAKVFTIVKQYRQKEDNLILLDGGDLLQGTPLAYYFNRIESLIPNPLILTMNYMRYDAFTVGNHDIEQGYHTYTQIREQSHFPWLSANAIRADRENFFEPFTIIEKNGIKIGIIGLTTPAIPMWLESYLYPGAEWQDMVTTASKWVRQLRPRVDVLIGLFHAGMHEGYSLDLTDTLHLPNENSSRLVAEKVPGFDVIFCGHSHRLYPYNKDDPQLINGTLFVMSGSHARYVGVAQLTLAKEKKKNWIIIDRKSNILTLDTVQAAPEILTINEPYHLKTLDYIRQVIGTSNDTISSRYSRWKDTPLVQFINQVQMAITGTDISFAASFNDSFILLPGLIRVKDIYGMYKYENFLYTVEMSGQQIKDYLEHCSRYFNVDRQTGRVMADPDLPGYNYDMAEGLGYEIDVRAPMGERIKDLKELKTGQPVNKQKIYRVAMNSYRAAGGGGHLSAAGIRQARIIWRSSEEIRNLLIQYIKTQGTIKIQVDNNWKLTGS